MKKIITASFLFGILLMNVCQAKVYKYTDADGNIHYSDTKPFEEAQEATIQPLTIIESAPVTNRKRDEHKQKVAAKQFKRFNIATPKKDATLWGTSGEVLVGVDLDGTMTDKHKIRFILDGKSMGETNTVSQMLKGIERGEHELYAQIINSATNKVIKSTSTIKFHVKQHSKK